MKFDLMTDFAQGIMGSCCAALLGFWAEIVLNIFCNLCLRIILCDTSKTSECHEGQRLCRANYIRFIQNCDVPEEVSVTFDPETDLSDDAVAVGTSRYERFYSVRNNYARENRSLRRHSRELSRVGHL